MLKSVLFLLLAGLTALAMPQNPAQPGALGAQTDRISIRGMVTNPVTSEGVPGILINLNPIDSRGSIAQDPQVLRDAATRAGIAAEEVERLVAQQATRNAQLANNSKESFSVETDRSGKFLIESVPLGLYTLTASGESYLYVPPNGGGFGSDTYNSQISVTPGQTVADISIPMVRSSTISGRVLDVSGRPASNVPVNALRLAFQQGRPVLQSSATKTTDDRGEFRLFNLPPGEYLLGVGQTGGNRGLVAQRGATAAEVPVRTYYPREVDPALASKIRIGSGEEVSGMNVTLRASRTYGVRGQITTTVPLTPVVGPRGETRGGNVTLSLSPRVPALGEQSGNSFGVTLDGNGAATFQLQNVLPGEYYLIGRMNQPVAAAAAGAAVQAANSAVFARMPLDVRDNVDGVRFVIPPPVDLKGSVVSGSPSVTRPPTMRVNLINQTTYLSFPAYGRGNATVEADGTFVFPGTPEGDYILDAALPVGARGGNIVYVSDVLFGGTSVMESGFHIDEKPPAMLQVVLNSGTGSIDGTVYTSAQKPAVGVNVVLVPLQHRRMPSRYQRTLTTPTGSFAFRSIPPGDYELYSWEEYLPTSEQDEAYMEKYKGKGQRVTVRAQSTGTTELHLIPRDSVPR